MTDRWFYIQQHFYDNNGEDCEVYQAKTQVFKVMDPHWMEMYSTPYLAKAIQEAERLNMEMINALDHLGEPESIKESEAVKSKGLGRRKKSAILDDTIAGFGGGGVSHVGGGT